MSSSDSPHDPTPTRPQLPPRELARQPLVLLILAVAAVGWILAFWALATRSATRNELGARITSLESERDVLSGQLTTLRSKSGTAADIDKRVAAMKADIAARESANADAARQLEEARQQIQAAQKRLQALAQETKKAEGVLEQRQGAIAETDDVGKKLTATRGELADVGERLVQARQQEAQIRNSLSELSAEATRRARDAASAEQRIQQARALEAQAQEQLAFARKNLAALEQRMESLTRELGQRMQQLERLRAQEVAPSGQGGQRQMSAPPARAAPAEAPPANAPATDAPAANAPSEPTQPNAPANNAPLSGPPGNDATRSAPTPAKPAEGAAERGDRPRVLPPPAGSHLGRPSAAE